MMMMSCEYIKSNIDEKEETKIRLMRALVEKQDPSSKVLKKQDPSLLYKSVIYMP